MNWLVWKEYRLNRLIVVVGAILLVVPYGVALVVSWRGAGHLIQNVMVAGLYSVALSQFTLALLGGNLIACERADRSAEFLAYLPLSPARILAGKIALSLGTFAVIWIPNLLILYLISSQLAKREDVPFDEIMDIGVRVLSTIGVTGFVVFCVGWLWSSFLESPTFAIFGGLVVPLLVILAFQGVAWYFELPVEEIAAEWYAAISAVLASACFAAGTWYYLRRVEP
jgi:ABC-type transport system involved in multi-copper enzyme maturation permease subunit